MNPEAITQLVEHGVLGALVVLQFGIILFLVTRLTGKVNGQATRIDKVERLMIEYKDPNDT